MKKFLKITTATISILLLLAVSTWLTYRYWGSGVGTLINTLTLITGGSIVLIIVAGFLFKSFAGRIVTIGSMMLTMYLLWAIIPAYFTDTFNLSETLAKGITGIIVGLIFAHAYCVIPAEPPHKALMTVFFIRMPVVLNEGMQFLLFRPFLFGVLLEDMTMKKLTLPEQEVRVPDKMAAKISGKVGFTPDPDNFINYKNIGGEEGVEEGLASIWKGVIREWSITLHGGPQTIMEFLQAHVEAIDTILKEFARNSLPKIPSEIPTHILFKYFAKPQKKPTVTEKKAWGPAWKKVKETIAKEIDRGKYTEKKLETDVEDRLKAINAVRQGRGQVKKPEWGITINLLTLTEPEPVGEAAEAMDKEVKERFEKNADQVEIENRRERANEIQQSAKDAGEKMTYDRALTKAQIETGKVQENVITIPGLEKVVEVVADALKQRGERNG